MNKVFLLVFFFVLGLCETSISQEIIVRGKVTDAETGEGMPLVNIVIKATGKGTTTDFDGNYILRLTTRTDSILAFYFGYLNKMKPIDNWVSQTMDFQLKPDVSLLEEVTVFSGENPAFKFIRKVVENKERNDKRNLSYYHCETYNRHELSIDNLSEKFRNKKIMRKIVQIYDSLKIIAGDDGKPILPVFVSETISDFYYRTKPEKTKEEIKALKVTGVGFDEGSFVSQLLGSTFQEYNFYRNTLPILGKDFVSPIADGWDGFYKYELADSLFYKGNWCYKIEFKPKRKEDLAFTGTMWIADTSFAIKQIDVSAGKGNNINYIDKIKIQQELEPTSEGPWVPVKTRVLIDISEVGDQSPGMLAKFYTSNKNIETSNPKPLKFFDERLVTNEDASLKTEIYWDQNRHDSLTATEKSVIAIIDSVKNMPVVKTYIDIVNIAVNGYKRIGVIDIGPYLFLYSHNNIEGHRFRLGMRTNVNFSNSWILKGYLAYGTRDSRFKYSAGAAKILSRTPWTVVSFERKEDYEQVGVPTEFVDNNLFLAAINWGILRGPYYTRQNTFAFQTDISKGITEKIIFKTKTFEPHATFPFSFYENDSTKSREYNTSEITLETRLAKDELFIQRDLDRVSLGTKRWPVLTLRLTAGIKGVIKSDFDYQKVTLGLSHILKLGIWGRTHFDFTAGKVFSKVPFPLLEVHMGNESLYYTTRAFNLMNFFEFVSDNYVTLKYRHYFEGLFLNRIPLMKKLKWRFLTAGNIAYGGVSNKNLSLIPPRDVFGIATPRFYSLEEKPYVEIGYGIENIFKIFRIDAYHRLTHLDHPGVKRFGIKFSIQFIL